MYTAFLWHLCFRGLLVFGLYKEDYNYLQILNVCPFDCIALVESGKVGRLRTGLTTPVEKQYMLLLQMAP